MQKGKKICVFGSANVDYFVYVHHIPVPGETIQSNKFMCANGGKGANQAVSVARLSSNCSFIGQVGNDDQMHSLKK
jgi:ribokinase